MWERFNKHIRMKIHLAKDDLLKMTADTMQKLSILGIGLGVFQNKTDGIYLAGVLLIGSYALVIWRAK